MFAKILVPLDGSELAERALEPAIRLARAAGSQIIFLRIPEIEQILAAPYSALDTYHLELSTARTAAEAENYLQDVLARYTGSDLPLSTRVVAGIPADVIIDVAAAEQVDLILISSHGRSGIRKWVLGSVAEAVLQKASCPVLVLHAERSIDKILVTLDGSDLAETALDYGFNLAQYFGSEMILLRIQDHLDYIDAKKLVEMEHMETGAQEMEGLARRSVYAKVDHYLQRLESRAAQIGLDVETATFVSDNPAQGILDFSRSRDIDCIVMATHGRTGLTRLMYGSVTEQVLSRFERSMLIIRPAANEAEEI